MYAAPKSVLIEDLIDFKDPKLTPHEKTSRRAAWRILWTARVYLIDYFIYEPTVDDFLKYEIVVRSNDKVCLFHTKSDECSIYGSVGFATLKTIQDALQARVGQKLRVVDKRSDKSEKRPLNL